MRYKFRGKTKEGKWIYGDLAHNYDSYIRIPEGSDRLEAGEWRKVDSETVGQFTNLIDKSGTEIYSGDIYDIGICTKVIRSDHFIEDTYELMKLIEDGATIEVIGNIHESEV